MTAAVDSRALRIARTVAHEAMGEGAEAVVLTGSYATAVADPESDIDVLIIGRGVEYELSRRGRFLLSVAWR
ncbi:MAG: nucleotidyltransferase domain-containing protein, partial [Chloroflexi bacterium]|nr:nucleotidyltransferase domain-containing protein [Chloroflexota bacterium]